MKVIPIDQSKSVADGWLYSNQEYIVLLIDTFADREHEYLIYSDRQWCAVLFPISEFKIVDHTIPKTWVISLNLRGGITLAPERWLMPDFWDSYHNDMPDAVKIFEEEYHRMLNSNT